MKFRKPVLFPPYFKLTVQTMQENEFFDPRFLFKDLFTLDLKLIRNNLIGINLSLYDINLSGFKNTDVKFITYLKKCSIFITDDVTILKKYLY